MPSERPSYGLYSQTVSSYTSHRQLRAEGDEWPRPDGRVRAALRRSCNGGFVAFSLENNTTGGYGVFYALTLCTFVAI